MDCFGLSGRLHCYAYRKPTHKLALWVLVSCHERSWRVGSWFRLP